MKDANASNESAVYSKDWIKSVKAGNAPAIAALILSRCPNLHTLTLDQLIHGGNWHSYPEYPDYWRQGCFNPAETFQCVGEDTEAQVLDTLGFTKLRCLKTNSLLPWPILTLPHLREVGLALVIPAVYEQKDFLPSTSCPNILKMDISIDIGSLQAGLDKFEREYLEAMQSRLSSLRQLLLSFDRRNSHVDLDSDSDIDPDDGFSWMTGSFETVLDSINSDSLETLIITTMRPLASEVTPARTLKGNRNLRYVIGPQDFFMSVDADFDLLDLPHTVERVEFTSSSEALNRWAQFVRDNREEQFPALKFVVIWDAKGKTLGPDWRLEQAEEDWRLEQANLEEDMKSFTDKDEELLEEEDDEDEDFESDEEDEEDVKDEVHWTQLYRIDRAVWNDLERLGIKVTWMNTLFNLT